ncbi:hypothetical protein [Thalassoglobus sp.]|uniref:hypothetical protein n=1 Tax=Thalassoglobus sp. TaxID=2795869 RepID=UPI003AA8D4FB
MTRKMPSLSSDFAGSVSAAIGSLLLMGGLISSQLFAQEAKSSDDYFDETKVVTLFSFDDVSIPFTQNLKLQMRSAKRHAANPVVQRGEDGSTDSWAVQFYGSVIRVDDKYKMWYVSVGDERYDKTLPRSEPWKVAYAESDDGVHWTKPNLGLVEIQGDSNNNLVLMKPHLGTLNVKVLYEPDEPNPDRRYKMGAHVWFPKNDVRLGAFAPYVSPDGINWKLLPQTTPVNAEFPEKDLVLPALHIEPVGGMFKWDGLYRISGQNAIAAARPYHGRVSREFISGDFENWSQASAISMVRTPQHTLLGPGRSREGEQTHEGISVWNRNNVLLGISGLWHGTAEWKGVTIDLGFVVSNDGVNFREPLHDWTFLKRGKDGAWDQGGLLQGQGFENIGEQTFVYYGAWDPRGWEKSPKRGGVGIATVPRDRFADLSVDTTTTGSGNYQMPKTVSEFLTKSIDIASDTSSRFYLNADGLGDQAVLKIELLDHKLVPLPKYSGKHAAIVRTNGFQTPITWGEETSLSNLPNRVRFKVTFEGQKKTDIRFNALYIRSETQKVEH